jgi:DNA-binding CsgD family transcriptional regulator
MKLDSELKLHIQAIQRAFESNSTVEDFLKTVVHSIVRDPAAEAAFLCKVLPSTQLAVIGSYGYPAGRFSESGVTNRLWDSSAMGKALRSGMPQFFSNKSEYLAAYPNKSDIQLPGDGFIAIPVWRGGFPVLGLGIALALVPENKKDYSSALVWDALRLALELALSTPSWKHGFQGDYEASKHPIEADNAANKDLTSRQAEILRLMGLGSTNRQIAGKMHLSPSTVGKETLEIYKKLGTHRRKSAAEFAVDTGLISLEPISAPAPLGRAAAIE